MRKEISGACLAIALRMQLPHNELSNLAKKHALKRVANGTNPFTDSEFHRKHATKRINDGTHHFLSNKFQSNIQRKRIENGTHHFLDKEAAKIRASKRVANGTHNLLGGQITRDQITAGLHPSQYQWKCPHCNKIGKGKGVFTRFHGNNCKFNTGFRWVIL